MAKAVTTLHLDVEAVIDLAGLIIAARTDAQFEYAELSGSYVISDRLERYEPYTLEAWEDAAR